MPRIPSLRPVALALASVSFIPTVWAQPPSANDAVLAGWTQKTGQEARLDARGVVEFRGVVSVDIYRNEVDVEAGDAATLSPLDRGTHQRTAVQFDWRHTIPDTQLTYAQGVFSNTDDRGLQPRFQTQMASFQAGRIGLSYRLALGDVAVNFSQLSTNQGIRGLWGDYQIDRTTLTYFAGTLAENWEALAGLSPRLGGPANLTPLRDVMGFKADQAFSDALTGFVTAQGYRDRRGELAEAALFSGQSASAGLRYATPATQAALEVASSRRTDRRLGGDRRGEALQAWVQHSFGALALRGGYNALDSGFATLAQAAAPGIREVYAGADWQVIPRLTYGLDGRDATTRTEVAGLTARSELATLTHRLSYRFADWPGLAATLSHQASRGRDAGAQSTDTETTQAGLGYAHGDWNGQITVGGAESCAAACTRQRQWQAGVGKSFVGEGRGLTLAASLGQIFSRPPAAPEQRQDQAGFNATLNHARWGQMLAGVQWQALAGGVGVPRLVTRGLNLDWSLPASEAWTFKSFLRLQERNRNDAARSVQEHVAGVQLSYAW